MGSDLSKHTGLIIRANNETAITEPGRVQRDKCGKTHKGLPGVGHHVLVSIQPGTLCTQSRVSDVHLVVPPATVVICADVTSY